MDKQGPVNIVLISSGQPSLNPRLVKEADCLADAGYQVKVIYQYWNGWGTRLDEQLLAGKIWRSVRVGGSPTEDRLVYWFSRARHKFGRFMAGLLGLAFHFPEMAIGRCGRLLFKEAAKHPAELYIAHNLGALPAAVLVSETHGGKCGFDAEDFHRHEATDDPRHFDVRLKSCIEDKYIPRLDYLSASSPLISEAYQQLYGFSPVTILNTFPPENLESSRISVKGKLRAFWFSQTVALGRGVSDCIRAIASLDHPGFELHLLGDCSPQNRQALMVQADSQVSLHFHAPIPPGSILQFASQFDIGLAMEPRSPHNRDICLTNKIISYIQAGLAVIATDTRSQQLLLTKYPGAGRLYAQGDIAALAAILKYYYENPEALRAAKACSLEIGAKELNWEQESKKFLSVVQHTLVV